MDKDPSGQTGDNTPANYEELEMMDHKTVTPGITNTGVLDLSETDNTPRYTAKRGLVSDKEKEREAPQRILSKRGQDGGFVEVLANKKRPYLAPLKIVTRLGTNR